LQALYHLSHTSSYSGDGYLMNYLLVLPSLALNHDHPRSQPPK
jgi:hypothetical protein